MEKEKIDHVFTNIENFLKRAFSIGEKYQLMEEFSFDMVILLLKSSSLNQQITGVKILTDLIKKVSSSY